MSKTREPARRDRDLVVVTVPGSRRLDGSVVPDRTHVMLRDGRRLVAAPRK